MASLNRSYFLYDGDEHNQAGYYFSYFNERTGAPPPTTDRLIVLFLSILTSVSALENGFLVVFILSQKHLHTVTNIFVVNIALVLLLLPPLTAVVCVAISQGEWRLGDLACKFCAYSVMQTSFLLVWNKAAIAAERHRKIVCPFKDQLTAKRAVLTAAIIWIAGLLVVGPVPFSQTELAVAVGNSTYTICTRRTSVFSIAVIPYTLVAGFLVPLLVIVVCYKRVMNRIARTESRLKARVSNSTATPPQTVAESCLSAELSTETTMATAMLERARALSDLHHSYKSQKNRQNRRVVRTLIIIVVVFLTLWIPNLVLLGGIAVDLSLQTFQLRARYIYAGISLLNISAIITPMLYVYSDKSMVDSLKGIFFKKKLTFGAPV